MYGSNFSTDMDDTLYPLSSGLNLACRKNIEGTNTNHENYNTSSVKIICKICTLIKPILFTEYMLKHLHMEESEVPKICLDFYKEYGTTMAGLKVEKYHHFSRFPLHRSFLTRVSISGLWLWVW